MGIVPAAKLLDAEAPGFHFEAVLGGEKSSPLPIGGVQGMAALFGAIRKILIFARLNPSKHGIQASVNIEISTGFEFAKNVSFIIHMFVIHIRRHSFLFLVIKN